MATYYIPSSSGWSAARPGSGTYFRSLSVRIVVTQTYNSATNSSSVTFKIQAKDSTGGNNVWTGYDGWSVTINGTSYTFDHTYAASTGSSSAWVDFKQNGSTKSWTITKAHNADGSASVSAGVNFTVHYRSYASKFSGSGTASFSNTPTYTLSISQGSGSTITVIRSGTTLSDGATLNRNDELSITFGTNTGYSLNTHTVNGTTFTSGNKHTVTGAVSVVSTATIISNTLTVSAGTGTTITVNRQTSPLGGASTGVITSGATVYYNDTLEVTFTANGGYSLVTHTIQGTTRDSGYIYTVKENAVSVVATSSPTQYILSVLPGEGSAITVNRTSSPIGGASSGVLHDGDVVYYTDTVTVAITVQNGYVLDSATINGSPLVSPYTVVGPTSVVSVTSKVQGGATIYDEYEFSGYYNILYTGQTWVFCQPIVYTGTEWEEY